jgi:hypothetical protein
MEPPTRSSTKLRSGVIAGVRYMVVSNSSIAQPNLRKALASAIPFNKILRDLKKL